mmetsp:Transcript_65064/g.128519  ORF Transcript_65064/g.128519 Transcript_65064/m.128519 type:complete len:110 (+) Transcript_65064:141-470(+)
MTVLRTFKPCEGRGSVGCFERPRLERDLEPVPEDMSMDPLESMDRSDPMDRSEEVLLTSSSESQLFLRGRRKLSTGAEAVPPMKRSSGVVLEGWSLRLIWRGIWRSPMA